MGQITMDIPADAQRGILEAKIKFHKGQYFAYTAEAKAARAVGGLDKMLATALGKMVTTEKLIAEFQKMIDELPEGEGDGEE